MRIGKLITFLACVVTLASCVTSKTVNLIQDPADNKKIPHYADSLPFEDYYLRVGDRLQVRVHSVDEQVKRLFNASGMTSGFSNYDNMNNGVMNFSSNGGYGYANELYTYLVLDDGSIDFPLVGRIPVRGKTTRQVKQKLEEELSSYIKDYGDYKMISVDVNVVQRLYSVISVKGSGTYAIRKEKMTIYEALAQAGDVGDWSDRSKVKIVREIEGNTKVVEFDVRSKDIINSEYYYVEPNDVIYLQQVRGKAFGINNAATTVAIVASTISFGGFVYAIVQRIINVAK